MTIDFSSFISACAGGFAGAIAAVYFQHEKEKNDTHKKNHAAILTEQYRLTSKIDGLWNIENQFLKEHEKKEDRFVRVPYIIHPLEKSTLNIEPLVFIANGDNPELLLRIQKSYEGFNVFLEMVRQRNEKLRELYLKQESDGGDSDLEPNKIRRSLTRDEQLIHRAMTDSVYSSFANAERTLKETLDLVHQSISAQFPGFRNIRYKRNNM